MIDHEAIEWLGHTLERRADEPVWMCSIPDGHLCVRKAPPVIAAQDGAWYAEVDIDHHVFAGAAGYTREDVMRSCEEQLRSLNETLSALLGGLK